MLEFHVNLMLVFATYGWAFFSVGLAIVLVWRSDSNLPLTKALPALAVFAFLQGLVELLKVLLLFRTGILAFLGGEWVLDAISVILQGASYVFLLWFGIALVARSEEQRVRGYQLSPLLFLAWSVGTLAAVHSTRLPPAAWFPWADDLARYLLALPAGFLAVWGMHKQKRLFDRLEMPRVGMDCIWAGAILTFYTLLTVLTPLRVSLLAQVGQGFDELSPDRGLPPQLLRAAFAVGIAFFVLRIVRAYQEELRRRVEDADRERRLAQEEAVEAHRTVEEQLRLWNETLEREVLYRTEELARRQREAEALYRIGTEIGASMDLSTILRSVADNGRQLLRGDVGVVTLSKEGQEGAPLRVTSGARTEAFNRICTDPGKGLVGKVVATGAVFAIDDYLTDPRFHHDSEVDGIVAEEGLRAHLAAPVKIGGETVGVVCVASRGDRRFGRDDEWLLAQLTLMTAIAIQNSQLYARAQQVAVLEERERIGREIHDGLAQALGCLGMMCGAAQSRLESGQVARVRVDLREMERIAREACGDAREAILGLRVSAYGGAGLVEALREYLRRFGEQCGLEAQLQAGPEWTHSLTGDAEVQIIRIVQEALSNVRKHAEARKVSVELGTSRGFAEITVRDDGRGFDASRCGQCDGCRMGEECLDCSGCHFGIQSMRERARSIGASLTVQSAPGKGTRVTIRMPLREQVHTDGGAALGTVA